MKEYTITFTADFTDILTEDDLRGDDLTEDYQTYGFALEAAVATGSAQASVKDAFKDLFADVHIRDFKLFVQEKEETHAED